MKSATTEKNSFSIFAGSIFEREDLQFKRAKRNESNFESEFRGENAEKWFSFSFSCEKANIV